MDLSYIHKLANYEDTCSEAADIRNKLNEENNIKIQQRKEQQTSYQKFLERYKQLENKYESLRQNLLQAETERENMSESYLNEKQRQQELLNKILSTRTLCEELTKYSTELQERLDRCYSGLKNLSGAYNKAVDDVKTIKQQYKEKKDVMQVDIVNLEERERLIHESRSQLERASEKSQQEAAARIATLELQCAEERHQIHQLRGLLQQEGLNAKTHKMLLQQKENNLTTLKKELVQLDEKRNKTRKEMEDVYQKQILANEYLKQDINRLEEELNALRNDNKALEELSATDQQNVQQYATEIELLKKTLMEHQKAKDNNLKELEAQKDKYESLKNEMESALAVKTQEFEQLANIVGKSKLDTDFLDAEIVKTVENYDKLKTIIKETEAKLLLTKEEINKLQQEKEEKKNLCYEMVTESKIWEKKCSTLNETILTHNVAITEGKTKLDELQDKFDEETKNINDIKEEKMKLAAINKELVQNFETEEEEYIRYVTKLEVQLEEINLSCQNAAKAKESIREATPQDDNAVLPPIKPMIPPFQKRNVENLVLPKVPDVYSCNFSDSSQSSLDTFVMKKKYVKATQMKQNLSLKRKNSQNLFFSAKDRKGHKKTPRNFLTH